MKELTLYDYQERALDGLREHWTQGRRDPQILYGPTGMGKTETAIALLQAAERKGSRTAMVLDRIVLVEQTSQRLDEYGIDHGVLMSGHWRYRPDRRIQICSAQTLEKRGSLPGVDLLIVDECHQTRKQTIEFIRNTGIRTVGLTATPFTKGLAGTYKHMVVPITTEALVDAGRLAPLRVFIAKQIDMTGAKKVAGEWSQDAATERGIQITGDIVSEWASRTMSHFGKPEKTIVFCAGVAHGEDLARKFAAAGFNFVSISYKDDDEFKAQAIKEFAKPDSTIQGLIATDILTKGFDVPDVRIGISARPFSKSLSSHIQQMGRVMRSFPGKDYALWLDHSGNYLRFRDDWESIYSDGPGELKDGREKAKPEPTEREKKEARCPSCGAVFPPRSDTCLHCGHTREAKSKIVAIAGQMEELVGKSSFPKAMKQDWYSQLLFYARMRGYSEGWAAHKYREKFGVWPRNLDETGIPPGREVSGWITSRHIAWAKRRAA